MGDPGRRASLPHLLLLGQDGVDIDMRTSDDMDADDLALDGLDGLRTGIGRGLDGGDITDDDGGDERVADGEVIRDCVDRLTQSGTAASAYAIDFGVLRDGRTVLLEVNDGYSLGRYGCPPDAYVDVLGTRWAELVELSR